MQHLTHGQKRLFLQPFAGIDHSRSRLDIGGNLSCKFPNVTGRHSKEQQLAVRCTGKIGGQCDLLRNRHARQLIPPFAVPPNLCNGLLRMVPDRHSMAVMIRRQRKTQPESAGTQYGYICHRKPPSVNGNTLRRSHTFFVL